MYRVSVVIAAGGKGTRMGASENKVYLKVLDKEILLHTVETFEKNKLVEEIIVVTGENDIKRCTHLLKECLKVKTVIVGGKTRQQSVYKGLIQTHGDIVLIHDGARALISDNEITNVIKDCYEYGAAAVGVKVKDTLKAAKDNFIIGTIDRENTYQIQTPQAFKSEIIKKAHKTAIENNCNYTDDCQAVEKIGVKIRITEGSYDNIKITTPDDIAVAEKILIKRRKQCE